MTLFYYTFLIPQRQLKLTKLSKEASYKREQSSRLKLRDWFWWWAEPKFGECAWFVGIHAKQTKSLCLSQPFERSMETAINYKHSIRIKAIDLLISGEHKPKYTVKVYIPNIKEIYRWTLDGKDNITIVNYW